MNSVSRTPRREPPSAAVELVVIVLGIVVCGMGLVVWAGARLSAVVSGGSVSGGLGDWLTVSGRLVSTPDDPSRAWGEHASGLPGQVVYWACTILAAVLAAAVVAGGVWGWRRWSSPSRTLFGVPVDARVARPRDVRPLVVARSEPPTGRMLLGRLAPSGPLLATEDRERHPAHRRRAARVQGDRGSVALIGPTRSGKTVLASTGIIGWGGPVVALSVKRDLYDATAAARARRGDLAVFDPGGVTGLPTARWTPLRDVATTSGALRAGRALAQAIPRNGVTGGDFWASHGETLTSAYMCLAGLSRLLPAAGGDEREPLTIGRLASWAFMHVGITDPTVNELIRLGLRDDQPLEVRLLAKDAMTKLMAFEGEDPRIRASIYATARLAFDAWTEPSVGHSASLDPRAAYWSDEIWERTPHYIDLEWLMTGPEDHANTLYLTAPATEFARLAPVLGGLLGDLREQIHAWDIAGRRLPKPLLIVIDEAGQLELQWLPEEVSTIAGLGGMFVTGWQSRAQINHRYGSLADAVLGGHRSKVIFNGSDDPSTLDYLSRVAGTQHVPQRGWSADTGGGRRTVSEQLQREDLLPAHVIRQMRRHEAVLLHGTLPPIHLRMVRWWEDKHLAALIPTGPDGRRARSPEDGTCPLQDSPRGAVAPVLEPTVVIESVGHLPTPRGGPQRRGPGPARTRAEREPVGPSRTARPRDQPQLALFASPADGRTDVTRNREAGRCERCGRRVPVGAGTLDRVRDRDVILCYPACAPTATR